MDVLTKAKFLHSGIQNMLRGESILRGRQRDAFDAMANMLPEQIAHSYFKLPTGFGKTVMFSLLAHEYVNQIRANNIDLGKNKVIILVPRLSLIGQTREKLKEFANIAAVSVFDAKHKQTDRDIIISTYQSMEKLFYRIGAENIGLVIADEAHHAIGDKRMSILNQISNYAPIIGFTATPVYSETHAVSDLLGAEIYSMGIGDAVNNEMLCPVKNILYRTSMVFDPSVFGFVQGSGDFNWKSIIDEGTEFDIMVKEIAQIYAYGECDGNPFRDMKTMINCPNIDIATAQARAINRAIGHDVAVPLHSRQKNFSHLMQDFRDNKFNVVCQVNTLTEGFDDEEVSLCINYPSASAVRIEQASGRALRINPKNSHKIAYVLDTVFRGGEQEPIEDTIITARQHGQVLFRDIAGAAVLIPNGFQYEPHNGGEYGGKNPIDFNFDIITDNKLLMTIEQHYNDWVVANNQKWLSPSMLKKYCELRASETIENRLNEMRVDSRMHDRICDMQLLNGRIAPCLRGDRESIKLFQKMLHETWITPSQLQQYCNFQGSTIENRLREMQTEPEMKDRIQTRKLIGGRDALCLRNDEKSIELFQSLLNVKWLSPSSLAKICSVKNAIKMEQRMNEIFNDPRLTGLIRMREIRPDRVAPYLRGDKNTIALFQQVLDETTWLPPSLLRKYCDITNPMAIEKCLREMRKDPKNKDRIQDIKLFRGRVAPCLHNDPDSIELFRKFSKEKWLSSSPLAKRVHLQRQRVENALENIKDNPRMAGHIENKKLQNGRTAPCLRDDAESIKLFLEIFREQKIANLKHGATVVAAAIIAKGEQKSDDHKR